MLDPTSCARTRYASNDDVLGPTAFVFFQALARATSFSLGWATALFFGQIPGGKERVVSLLSALALAWTLVVVVGVPLFLIHLALEGVGVRAASERGVDDAQLARLVAAIVLLPPVITLATEFSNLTQGFRIDRWLRSIPRSYLIALSLGSGVGLMLLIGPLVLLRQRRRGMRQHHIPILVAQRRFTELLDRVEEWLGELAGKPAQREVLMGPRSLPLRALRYAAAHLLGSVVRQDPTVIRAGDVEVTVFATDLSVAAPERDAYRLRAELDRRLALADEVHFTWSTTSQKFERKLWRLHREGGRQRLRDLAELQEQIDAAPMNVDEWSTLYRVALQIEQDLKKAG